MKENGLMPESVDYAEQCLQAPPLAGNKTLKTVAGEAKVAVCNLSGTGELSFILLFKTLFLTIKPDMPCETNSFYD